MISWFSQWIAYANSTPTYNRLYAEMGCIGMEIKVLKRDDTRRRSLAISHATDKERRFALKDNVAPY